MPTDVLRRRRGLLMVGALLAVVIGIVVTAWVLHARMPAPGQEHNPFAHRAGHVAPDSEAARAAAVATGEEAELLRRLAEVPTGIWLTPEELPRGRVGTHVEAIARDAREERQVPVFVIYGIPGRDCTGGQSSGGLPVGEYVAWVREIAAAAGPWTVAVLEPDALAAAEECGLVEERVRLMGEAVRELRDAEVTTYIDAGHSDWIAPEVMADLLGRVGVEKVRGFATNTAAFGATRDEVAYARQVAGALAEAGVADAHYVIDSSRNGAGSNGEWCNPEGRAVGVDPGYVEGDGQDAFLWIKPPGESDGACNGEPAAGEWSQQLALDLVRNAGW